MTNSQFGRKKTQSVQDAINVYLKIIPKPPLPRSKLIELILTNNHVSSIGLQENHKSPQSLLTKIDSLIRCKMFDNTLAGNFLKTLKKSENLSLPNLRLDEVKSKYLSPRCYECLNKEKKHSRPARINVLSPIKIKGKISPKTLRITHKSPIPTYLKSPTFNLVPIHKRRKSSIDISKLSINAWDAKTPNNN